MILVGEVFMGMFGLAGLTTSIPCEKYAKKGASPVTNLKLEFIKNGCYFFMIAKLFLSQILLDNFLIHLEVLLAWFVNTLVNVFWLAEFFFLFAFLLLFLLSKQFLYNSTFYTNYMKPKLVTNVEEVHITNSRKWTLINTQSSFNISKLMPMSAIARLNRKY